MFSQVLDRAREEGLIYVEGICDRAGAHGVYVYYPRLGSSDVLFPEDCDRYELLQELFEDELTEKVVFRLVSIRRCGLLSLSSSKRVTDVDTMYENGDDLADLVRRELAESDYSGLMAAASRYDAHIVAAETARVPLNSVPAQRLMAPGFFESFYRMRAVRTLALRAKRIQRGLWKPSTVPNVAVRAAMALAGPEIDGHVRDGKLAFPSFRAIGGVTKRIGHRTGSINCMNVKKGDDRKKIVSRFSGGKVVSFDFNAIDYRCIVSAIPELRDLYVGAGDFHSRTVELLTGHRTADVDLRNVIKNMTYVHFYGGSVESCMRKTGLSKTSVEMLLSMFRSKLPSVEAFRERIVGGWMPPLPETMELPRLEEAEHDGAKLAYFAQTCASHAFKAAIVALNDQLVLFGMMSKLMFTVHDEAVVDVHPEELDSIDLFRLAMEDAASAEFGMRFTVKTKVGDTYE